MTDTLHAALVLLNQDLVLYRSSDSDSDYSRAYNAGARQATERAIRFIEHALTTAKAEADYKTDTYAVRITPRADAAYYMGPFKTEAEAQSYSNSTRGYVGDFTKDVESEIIELTPVRC